MKSNNSLARKLKIKLEKHEARISIVGLGYVGLPLAIRFNDEGFKVNGLDIDKSKIERLNSKKSYIKHIDDKTIETLLKNNFQPSSSFNLVKNSDVIIICVPTPLGIHNEPDLSYVHKTLDAIKPFLKNGQMIVLESTTYPGTTEEEIVPFIEEGGYIVGESFFVGYSPEREDPGNKNYTTKNIPKVVSGHTKHCLSLTKSLYKEIVTATVPVSSTKVAEMTKILENIHRAVNIGLVNELKIVADKMGINIYEVIDAAATKPFGFTPYYPGPGLGGHCIPIDPYYLSWKAKEVGMNTRFIELAGEINKSMPSYVVQKIAEILNSHGQSIKGSKILILGLTYKKNVDDLRESPSLEILKKLKEMDSRIDYCDPHFDRIPLTRKNKYNLKGKKFNSKTLKNYDLVLLATDHDEFDFDLIRKEAKIVVDTRGKIKSSKNVFRA